MTYVAFFERDVLENLCTCLALAPDKVILIGDRRQPIGLHAERYEELLRARREAVEFEAVCVDKDDIRDILEALERIVREEPECAFDLTGGGDLFLVAMGIISERHKDRHLQMHRFNIRNNTVYDCDLDGVVTVGNSVPQIGIREMIYACGGDVVSDEDSVFGTHEWDWSDEFYDQLFTMWDICRENVRKWNVQIGLLGILDYCREDPDGGLTASARTSCLRNYMASQGWSLDDDMDPDFLRLLWRAGLVEEFSHTEETTAIRYCSDQVRRCLTNAGRVLELMVCAGAMACREPDGSPTYQDVMTGVTICWDGAYSGDGNGYDTLNEIDVMMIRGMVPVFVSCKNGDVNPNELYKLNTVAARFGGQYAKKVLIAAALDPERESVRSLRRRAEEMGIRMVFGFRNMGGREIRREIRTLWCK